MKTTLTLLTATLLLTACSQTVSLLDYTTEEDLKRKGLTPKIIEELDRSSQWNFGYKYYNGNYQSHKINNFEILSNPDYPDKLYIIKNGNFLLSTHDNNVRIYNQDTKLPNPSDVVIDWLSEDQFLIYYNDEKVFYDNNIDGIDMIAKKMPYIGDDYHHNFSEVIHDIPRNSIVQANIEGKVCVGLAKNRACCKSGKNNYELYIHDFREGWHKQENALKERVFELCNPDSINQTRIDWMKRFYN